MGILDKPKRPLPLKPEYSEEYCGKCKKITTFNLEPCVGYFCCNCGERVGGVEYNKYQKEKDKQEQILFDNISIVRDYEEGKKNMPEIIQYLKKIDSSYDIYMGSARTAWDAAVYLIEKMKKEIQFIKQSIKEIDNKTQYPFNAFEWLNELNEYCKEESSHEEGGRE